MGLKYEDLKTNRYSSTTIIIIIEIINFPECLKIIRYLTHVTKIKIIIFEKNTEWLRR